MILQNENENENENEDEDVGDPPSLKLRRMKVKTDRWAAYGKWRSGVYPDADLDGLTAVYQVIYHLPDIRVVSIELRPFHGMVRVECGYPS